MKSKLTKVLVFTAASVLLLAFQNCSKLGTNGIAVEDSVLSLEDVTVLNPPVGTDVSEVPEEEVTTPTKEQPEQEVTPEQEPVKTPVAEVPKGEPAKTPVTEVPKEEPAKTPEVIVPVAEQPPVVEDEEVADAIRICNKEADGGLLNGAEVKAIHNNMDLNAENVSSIRAVHSHVVLRAQVEEASVGDSKITHGALVLCDFAKVASIKGVQTKVIVVGGEVAEVNMVQSTLVLVNAKVGDYKGVKTMIKRYSLK